MNKKKNINMEKTLNGKTLKSKKTLKWKNIKMEKH